MTLSTHKGFTLVELMCVIGIIAIALAIAIPSYFNISKVSKQVVCVNNLRKITAAVEQWALDNNISSGVAISQQQEDEIYSSYIRGNKPGCPSDGEYSINTVGVNPQVQCTKEEEGHRI